MILTLKLKEKILFVILKNKTKISVLLPVYNAEKYIKAAILSILNQSFSDFELLVIDDGSTDQSLDIIKEIKDERISLVQNPKNLGLVKTLNKGLELAKGEFIARMDADDICLPTRFEKQVLFLEKNKNIDILGSSYEIFGQVNKTVKVPTSPDKIKLELLFNNVICHPSIMIRKSSLFKNELSYNSKFVHNEDWALWLESIQSGLVISNLDEVLLKYRIDGQNITTKNLDSKVNRYHHLFNHYLPTFLPLIEQQTLLTHLKITLPLINKSDKLQSYIDYFDCIDRLLTENGYEKKLIQKKLKPFKVRLFYLLADLSKKKAIKYCVKNRTFKFAFLRYLLFTSLVLLLFNHS